MRRQLFHDSAGFVRAAVRLSCLVPLMLLGACASFSAQQHAVLGPVNALPAAYSPVAALETYAAQTSPEARSAFRNTVIGVYMTASDGNFNNFRRSLSRETRGANFGFGSVFTALTGGASIAGERTANILAALASGVGGIHGRLSREVYFERTLPALLTGMEANRTRVRTDIMGRMGQGDQYSLTAAFSDLARYESAGSLDGAIETITTQAAQLRDEEQARFENVIGLGRVATPATRVELRTLGDRIDALVSATNGLASLTAISQHLGLPTNVDAEAQSDNILAHLQSMGVRDPTSLSRFVEEMQQKGVDLSQ